MLKWDQRLRVMNERQFCAERQAGSNCTHSAGSELRRRGGPQPNSGRKQSPDLQYLALTAWFEPSEIFGLPNYG